MNKKQFNDYLSGTFNTATRFAGLLRWLLPRIECSCDMWEDCVDYMMDKTHEELPPEALAYLHNLSNEEIKRQLSHWFNVGINWELNGYYDELLRWDDVALNIKVFDPKPTRTVNLDNLS